MKYGRAEEALKLFWQMEREDVPPDEIAFLTILQACAKIGALDQGRQVHFWISKIGIKTDKVLGNALIDMYSKCGSLQDAHIVFNRLVKQDVVSWNVIILAYAQHELVREAWALFKEMKQRGVKPDKVTFMSILKACTNLEQGKDIHAYLCESGLESDLFIRSSLVNMYIKYGSMEDAGLLFDTRPEQDVVLWNAMITGYVLCEHCKAALDLFWQMEPKGLIPDKVTFIGALNACARSATLHEAKLIHMQIIKRGYESDVLVGSSLVDMYTKCSSVDDAYQVFDRLLMRNVFSWTAMIAGYAQHGQDEAALHLFKQMEFEGIKPDEFVFVVVLNSCASLVSLNRGKQIHMYVRNFHYENDLFVGSALLNMYTKCGSLSDARRVFDCIPHRNACTWTAMIAGYVKHGHAEKALELFQQMKHGPVRPDESILVSVLNACASVAGLEQGKQIHRQIFEHRFETDKFLGSALVDMYAKCGCIEDARNVFDEILERDVVSWTAMITGYTQQGQGEEALELWWQMEQEGVNPDELTFVSILNACAGLASLDNGKRVHMHIIKREIKPHTFIGATLIDMYAKCGHLDMASHVFEEMLERDVISWNAMIAACAQHGQGNEVLCLVEQMQYDNIKFDHITFLGIFSACSHMGLVDEALYYFDVMTQFYGITLTAEHNSCIIDLLGRAGHLEMAHEFISKMPVQPIASVWRALLGACRVHGNLDLAVCAAEYVLELEPQNTAAFVLLSNICADATEWSVKETAASTLDDFMKTRNEIWPC